MTVHSTVDVQVVDDDPGVRRIMCRLVEGHVKPIHAADFLDSIQELFRSRIM